MPSLNSIAMGPAHGVWLCRLTSGLRTAVACCIVGCATLFGPPPLQRMLAFPAFSYLTAVLIVSDATLGDTLRGCWHVLCATVQAVVPAMLSLLLIRAGRLSAGLVGGLVAVSVFVVGLPKWTHVTAKRIAFGQIVIVYVGAAILGEGAGAIPMHLLHVASSTALGAFASALALLFPYPRLASTEVNKLWKCYAENASGRFNLFLEAFSAPDNSTALDSICEAKFFSERGDELLQTIRLVERGIPWERPWTRLFRSHCFDPGDRLQTVEIPLRGMEIALSSFASFPIAIADDELRVALQKVNVNTILGLEQAKCPQPLVPAAVPNSKGNFLDKPLQALKTISPAYTAPSTFFFLSCVQLLQDGSPYPRNTEPKSNTGHISSTKESRNSKKPATYSFKIIWSNWSMSPVSESLVFALKCSLSLGLAVLFGLMYNKENAYWSGLTIAISFATGRQAIFTLANARAQGTAMGSVFGLLGCFVSQSSMVIRLLLLLPWIIFTSFLMHSRMYGQAGGISAVIGALLILGRKNYGKPSEFAIARITEAFIGLSCFIVVETLLHPRRASTLAKVQLSQSLATLQECTKEMVVCVGQKDKPDSILQTMRAKQDKLKMNIKELNKFIEEAKLEPNFWFLPFPGACYLKLWESLSKMEDLLLFVAHNIDFLLQASQRFEVYWKEVHKNISSDLELLNDIVASSLKYLEKITSIASLEKELQKKIISHDLELGRPPDVHWLWGPDDEEIEKMITSFLQHSEETINVIHTNKDKEELKSQMVLSLGALGFCLGSLMRETRQIEKGIQELVQSENPSSYIDFYGISCKINALNL